MDAYEILVVTLSILLAIFLILSIIAVSLVLKLINSLRQVVAKGEHLVDNAEAIGETLRRNAAGVGIIKLLMTLVGTINKAKK